MRSQKAVVALLGVIAAALVTIAVVLVTTLGASDKSSPERDAAERGFRDKAEWTCAGQGVNPVSQVAAFEECVDAVVKRNLRNWDEKN